jgi:hypothetical protein
MAKGGVNHKEIFGIELYPGRSSRKVLRLVDEIVERWARYIDQNC